MRPAPIPANETERIADLHALKVLATEPEERYDRLTRLASGIFDVPIAYLALVDSERQWFKSRCGLSDDSTDRSVSFCGHAIMEDRLMIVEDALEDERFHDNPMVTGPPNIRFYAGHPLRGQNGHNIGTFCIADTNPRSLSRVDTVMLGELAAVAEHELGLVDLLSSQHELLSTKNALLTAQQQQAADLDLAGQYVRSQLPATLEHPRVRIESRVLPSSSLGGDFIGYTAEDNSVVFYLLDVSGHGVASGLLAVSLHHAIRQIHARQGFNVNPGDVLTELNQLFQLSAQGGRFATMWYGHLDLDSGLLNYANAGHHPALLIADGETEELTAGGPPVGVVSDVGFETSQVELAPNARLYQFSDGLYEELTAPAETEPRTMLHDEIAAIAAVEVAAVDPIIQRLRQMANVTEFNDDVSLLELTLLTA